MVHPAIPLQCLVAWAPGDLVTLVGIFWHELFKPLVDSPINDVLHGWFGVSDNRKAFFLVFAMLYGQEQDASLCFLWAGVLEGGAIFDDSHLIDYHQGCVILVVEGGVLV